MPREVNARQFKDWARNDVSKWRTLKGQTVVHKSIGEGPVKRVYSEEAGIFIVVDYVGELARIHSSRYFDRSFKKVILGEPRAKQISETQAPIERDRIKLLREKIAAGEVLQPHDLRWLGTGDHISELEDYLKKHGSDWPVAKVGAYWRTCGLPERNLDVTKGVETNSSPVPSIAPIWTTRGAAFADLGRSKEGERCAKRAISCNETYYPHNLLGRVYFNLGDEARGDRHFDRAHQLGSEDRWQDDARRQGREGQPVDPSKPSRKANTDGESELDSDVSSTEEVPF